MSTFDKLRLGARYALNHALQEVDVHTDGHLSRPNSVYLHLLPTCNLKCIHCNLPRVDGIEHGTLRRVDDSLSTPQWLRSLSELRDWLGPFKLNISGGEPLIHKDALTILRHCCDRGIFAGITTNGTLIDADMADALTGMGMFNINISLDGFREGTHLHFRGRHYDRTMAAFGHLLRARERNGAQTRVLVKYTLMGYNLDEAIEVLRWAKDEGLDGVMMQPLELRHEDTELSYLWPQDLHRLDDTVDQLMALKREGYPLLNDWSHLRKFKTYFRAEITRTASLMQREGTCHVGVTNFFIGSNGDVVTCFYMDPVGNLQEQTPREIWESALARKRREEIRTCGRDCLLTCMATRTLRDKAEIFLDVF